MNVFIAALKDEVPNLDYFHISGVGKINATIKACELIQKYKPTTIINYGTAGALNNNLSGLIEFTKFYQRDMDCRGLLSFKLGETPFDEISEIILKRGFSCGSGDNFVNNKIELKTDVVDMEAYAIAKVCKKSNINFLCFKYISDNANEDANLNWQENCKKGEGFFEKIRKNRKIHF